MKEARGYLLDCAKQSSAAGQTQSIALRDPIPLICLGEDKHDSLG
jgi:hypothetical protein